LSFHLPVSVCPPGLPGAPATCPGGDQRSHGFLLQIH
jgi:hypothetical protein